MKKVNSPKKLGLSKETLAVLGQQSLKEAKGGTTPLTVTVPIAISVAYCDEIYDYLVNR